MAQRPGRVDVAKRLEPGAGLGRRQPGRLGRQPGHRVEQRPVEQLLVQPPDLPGVAAPLLVEVGRRVGADPGTRGREPRLVRPVIESHRPAQPAKYGGILGQGVGTAEPVQLEQVLGAAQEPVGGAELVGVGPAPHRLHVLDEVLAAGRLPDQRAEGVRVGLTERHVARYRSGLE